MAETDVVILGGGPAASAAAITCALKGLKVTLLDRARSPRHAVSESLHPLAEPLLEQIGALQPVLNAGFQRFPGAVVAWDGPEFFDPFVSVCSGPALGLQVWRADLDTILLNLAREQGVRVWQPAEATGLMKSGNRVVGVKTTLGRVLSRFTIDATGSRRVLGDWMSIPDKRVGPPRTAWSGLAEGSCPARDEYPALRAEGQGWTWVARVRDSTYTWTHLNLQNQSPRRGWLPEELAGAMPIGRIRKHDVTWRLASRPAGPGYFLVGDAAAMLDPAAQHGMVQALMSGLLAANLIALQCELKVTTIQAIDRYNDDIHAWFQRDSEQLASFYARLSQQPQQIRAHPNRSIRSNSGSECGSDLN